MATAAHAQVQVDDLLPDIPAGTRTVRLVEIADVRPDVVTDIANAGDGSGRLFIVSPRGVIRIWRDGAIVGTPFLNAPATPSGSAMSSLAFHPQFASNGKLYLITGQPTTPSPHYSPPQADTAGAFDNVLVEYEIFDDDADAVDPDTRRDLLRMHKNEDAHNVNDLAFAHDGTAQRLFIATGDGGLTRTGSPTHYETNAQATTLPYGKVLRIDVDSVGPNGRYAIPADNPYASGAAGSVPEIFARGLRNPWRITSDRETNELYVGSNGDFSIESVLRVQLGENYGWADEEGGFHWDPATGNASENQTPNPDFTAPLARYDHKGTVQAFGSIIGGYVYRGARMPDFHGRYIFYDWVAGKLVSTDTSSGALELVGVDRNGSGLGAFDVVTFGEDEVGELYVGGLGGRVKKLAPPVLCGDLTGDDDLGPGDVSRVRAHLAGGVLSTPEEEHCDVTPGAASCDLLDSVVLRRAVSGLQPGVAAECTAAGG